MGASLVQFVIHVRTLSLISREGVMPEAGGGEETEAVEAVEE